MTEDTRRGRFSLSEEPERTCSGSLGALDGDSSRWHLVLDQELVESPRPHMLEGTNTYRLTELVPGESVRASAPRVIFGDLDDGTKVTLLDAQLDVVSVILTQLNRLKREPITQSFKGWRILHGTHIGSLSRLCHGVRWTLPRSVAPRASATSKFDGGRLIRWEHGDAVGVEVHFDTSTDLLDLADHVTHRVCSLYAIASGIDVNPLRREILIDDTWHQFGPDSPQPKRTPQTDFLPAAIEVERLAQWVELSSRLGVLPFTMRRNRSVLQQDLQIVAAGLEGFHRHIFPEEPPFPDASENDIKQANRAAAKAAAEHLTSGAKGDPGLAFVKARYHTALAYVNEMFYRERLAAVIQPILEIAPGLFGPDPGDWTKAMAEARNHESHRFRSSKPETLDAEVSRYIVLLESGRWALRIATLLQLADQDEVAHALRSSQAFQYSLANMDHENYWPDFSCVKKYNTSPG